MRAWPGDQHLEITNPAPTFAWVNCRSQAVVSPNFRDEDFTALLAAGSKV